MQQKLLIGCVADDFTGAGDAASFLAANGIKTLLTNGCPAPDTPFARDIEAVVIALKSRTQPTAEAVNDTLAAFDYLRAAGAKTLYFKYCSTFDSTPQGNIGPVIDAVLERYEIPYTILCPALPVNGRIVRDGVLYVNGVPLAESHMKDHPLTPMWASDLCELMRPQSKYPCHKLTTAQMHDPKACAATLQAFASDPHYSLAVDYADDADGAKLAELFGNLPFLTGGSGLLADYAKACTDGRPTMAALAPTAPGARLLFAGSCSIATRGQVACWFAAGKHGVMLSPQQLASGAQTLETLWADYQSRAGEDILFYSAGSGGVTERADDDDAARLEQTMAALAKRAVDAGCTRLIVAGGETSGAVTQALGCDAYYIGETVAPGVPIMAPVDRPGLRLVLKSGNFGDEQFFLKALATPAEVHST